VLRLTEGNHPMADTTPTDVVQPEPVEFTPEQQLRARALDAARAVLSKRGFASSELAGGPAELVDLAVYIVDGVHPLDRYETAEEVPAGADD